VRSTSQHLEEGRELLLRSIGSVTAQSSRAAAQQ